MHVGKITLSQLVVTLPANMNDVEARLKTLAKTLRRSGLERGRASRFLDIAQIRIPAVRSGWGNRRFPPRDSICVRTISWRRRWWWN